MNYPYKINYGKSGFAETIEYSIGKKKEEIISEPKKSLELLCDIINSADPYHLYYMYTNSGRTSEAKDLLNFATAFIDEYKEKTYYPKDLLSNPAFRATYNTEPLTLDWLNNNDLIHVLKRFQNEVFYFDVKYNPSDGSLIFINDPFLSNTTKSQIPMTLDREYSGFPSSSPIGLRPLSLQFAYSPFQFQIYRRFESLCDNLREILISLIVPNAEDNIFIALYLQSREFVLYHLEILLRRYYPNTLLPNAFLHERNNLAPLMNSFPLRVEGRNTISSTATNYMPTHNDFLASFARNNKENFLHGLTDCLKDDIFYNEKELESSSDIIKSNNIIIRDLYLNCPGDMYITGIDYHLTNDNMPCIELDSIVYTNIVTHEVTVNMDVNYSMPIPMPSYYDIAHNAYASDSLDILSVLYNDTSSPLLLPVFNTSEVDISSFLQEIGRQCHAPLIESIEKTYEESTFSKRPYVETDSLGVLLSELLRSLNSDSSSKVIRCAECHKYFVIRHKHDKYCDSAIRESGTPPQGGSCSFKAKQRIEKGKHKYVRQLYNLKRNQAARLSHTAEYFERLVITSKSDITAEYMRLMFYLKQTILKDYIYDEERFFIYEHLTDSSSQKELEELKSYGVAFFPTTKAFKQETPKDLPNTNNHICSFYNLGDCSFIDSSHMLSFDWSKMLHRIIKDNQEPHKIYMNFRGTMIEFAKKFPSLFNTLPPEIVESFIYLNSIDSDWQELIEILPHTQAETKRIRRGR